MPTKSSTCLKRSFANLLSPDEQRLNPKHHHVIEMKAHLVLDFLSLSLSLHRHEACPLVIFSTMDMFHLRWVDPQYNHRSDHKNGGNQEISKLKKEGF